MTTFAGKWPSRYGTVKHLEVHVDAKEGDEVTVTNAESGKVYGPYRVAYVMPVIAGALTADAMCYAVGAAAKAKPLTKAELEQQNAQLLARLTALEASAAPAQPQPAKSK